MTPPEWLVAWAGDEQSAVLEVTASGSAADAVAAHVPALVLDGVASRIADRDGTLWGASAERASTRLGWTDVFEASRQVAEDALALRQELADEGVTRVVLCGTGALTLAPAVAATCAGLPLVVLDTTTGPAQVRRTLERDLATTVVVVSSRSGAGIETDGHRRAFEGAFAAAGIDPAGRIVVVTDPGSPLDEAAQAAGYRAVFHEDPTVGDRFSALTAFGLVPSALAGVDVLTLLDDAEAVADLLCDDAEGNPAFVLASAIAGTSPLRDKLILVGDDPDVPRLTDWIGLLVGESTGRDGKGLLPVVVEDDHAPEVTLQADDTLVVRLVAQGDATRGATTEAATTEPVAIDGATIDGATIDGDATEDLDAGDPLDTEVTVSGPLGSQLLLWEYAIAVAGRMLDLNPFDEPDGEGDDAAVSAMHAASPWTRTPDVVDGEVEIRATGDLLTGVADLTGALTALLDRLAPSGHLAVTAYLDREQDAALASVRPGLAAAARRPVTLSWGSRLPHPTGRNHHDGPETRVHLQVTADAVDDLEIPRRPFTFGGLVRARAAGDARVLADLGRPVLRLHLTDRTKGIAQVLDAVSSLTYPGSAA